VPREDALTLANDSPDAAWVIWNLGREGRLRPGVSGTISTMFPDLTREDVIYLVDNPTVPIKTFLSNRTNVPVRQAKKYAVSSELMGERVKILLSWVDTSSPAKKKFLQLVVSPKNGEVVFSRVQTQSPLVTP
jgi:hypothetical protein